MLKILAALVIATIAGAFVVRARLARDFFTYGHFPLVLGVAFLASVIEHVVAHPEGHLHGEQLWLLGTSIVLIGGGFMGLQWRLRRQVAPERPIAIAVVLIFLATAASHVGGVAAIAIVGATAALLGAVAFIVGPALRPLANRDC